MWYFYNTSWLDQRGEAEKNWQDSGQTGRLHNKVIKWNMKYFTASLDNAWLRPISPQGLKFRSKTSLQAFLLKNGQEDLNINLFNFSASKDDELIAPFKAMQKRRKEKEQQYDAPGVSKSPLNTSARTCHALSSTVHAVNDSGDSDHIVPEKMQKIPSASCTVDDVAQKKSPHRAGLLREKILRLVPNQQNACKEKQAGSLSVPTLNLEPPADGENKSEDVQGGKERQVDSRGGNDSEHDAGANSVGTEVLSPKISGGSCAQEADSQNSKHDLQWQLVKADFQVVFFFIFTEFSSYNVQ